MTHERAVDAASKRLRIVYGGQVCDSPYEVAKRAVEAAAPILTENTYGDTKLMRALQRAARAEANAARWQAMAGGEAARVISAEALADRLAEALRNCLHWSNEDGNAALAAWEEARIT